MEPRHPGPVWRTRDPRGREVVLTPDRWLHILIRHNEMNGHRQAILDTVAAPTMIRQGRATNERHYFRRRVGPSMWLHVVVHYDDGSGRITTAFGRRLLP